MASRDPIVLRHTTLDDLDWVIEAEGAPDNRPYVTQWSREEHDRALEDEHLSHLIIEDPGAGRRVGYVILAGLGNPRDSVEVRRIVVTDKGRGYGRHALRVIKKMYLEDLKTRRLWLDVRPNNPRAKRLYESEGFVVEETGPDGLLVLSIKGEDA